MSGHSVTIIPHGGEDTEDIILDDDGFFPDISLSGFRESMRVDTTVPDTRVRDALTLAAIKVNDELASLVTVNSDHAALEDVPAPTLDGTSVLLHRYRAAVYSTAKADLIERYRDFDSTQSGHDEADKLEKGMADYRQVAREQIRALLGKPRVVAELL